MKKFILERHAYAPEINRIIFANGATMATPYCTTLSEVKQKYFKKPTAYVLGGKVQRCYIAKEWQGFNKTAVGRADNYTDILAVKHEMRKGALPVPFTRCDGATFHNTGHVVMAQSFKKYV